MASWLVRLTLERVVQVRALAMDILFLGKTLKTPKVPLSTLVFRWVQANLMLGDNPAMD